PSDAPAAPYHDVPPPTSAAARAHQTVAVVAPRRPRVSGQIATMTTTTYELDPVHSHVGFSVRHMMVSQQRGQFQGVTGTLTLDREDITRSRVEVAIDVATINTNNTDRDHHTRRG